MSCRNLFFAALSAALFAGDAAFAAEPLPSGRWYNVGGYKCRVSRDYVDHRPSVIASHRNISQRACADLCNGTPNCAAYNYFTRIDRSGKQARPALECQLLSSADKPVVTFVGAPGESAYVCYKSPPETETPDLDTDARRSFQDGMRPSAPPPPPPPPPRND